jgi:hypothetical protein
MSKRVYNFERPYVISGWKVGFIPGKLRWIGVWDNLPAEIIQKIEDAADHGRNLEVTAAELDLIDDESWTKIAKELNLDWESTE